jgi:hypothetical protein
LSARLAFLIVLGKRADHPQPAVGGVSIEHVGGLGGLFAAGFGQDFIDVALGGGCPLVIEAESEQAEQQAGEDQRQGDPDHAAAGLDHGDDFAAARKFPERIEQREQQAVGQ